MMLKRERMTWSYFCMLLYIVNAMCKYFFPGSVTKLLPILALVVAIYNVINKSVINTPLNLSEKTYMVFLFIWYIGCFYSPDTLKGLGYAFSFTVALMLQYFVRNADFKEKKIMRWITLIAIALCMSVILQPIMPDSIEKIASGFSYTSSQVTDMKLWAKNGWYSGLFPDRAPAAFFGVVLSGMGMYYFYHIWSRELPKKKKKYLLILSAAFIAVGLYCILLTAKRGLLLGCMASIFFNYIINKKANKGSIFNICFVVAILVVIIWILANNLEAAQPIIEKFEDKDNFYTGRIDIYENIYAQISKSPILGSGTASANYYLGIGGHNIYLTVMMENGIIGAISFVAALITSLVYTVRNAFYIGKYRLKNITPTIVLSIYFQMFFIVYGFSGNPLYDNYILYFYVFALLLNGNAIYRAKSQTGGMK